MQVMPPRAVARLPDDQVYLRRSRGTVAAAHGRVHGRHIWHAAARRRVHISTPFNFPVWGMLEKLAPTLIAGGPLSSTASRPPLSGDRSLFPPDDFSPAFCQMARSKLVTGGLGRLLWTTSIVRIVSALPDQPKTALKLPGQPVLVRTLCPDSRLSR